MELTTQKTVEQARQYAIEWQAWQADQILSYSELLEWQNHFLYLAKQFPELEAEFIENGLI